MSHECRHIMPNGSKCKAPALTGKPYCYFHTRVHRLTSQPPISPDGTFRLPVLEDQTAIQLAVSQVLAHSVPPASTPAAPDSSSTASRSPRKL